MTSSVFLVFVVAIGTMVILSMAKFSEKCNPKDPSPCMGNMTCIIRGCDGYICLCEQGSMPSEDYSSCVKIAELKDRCGGTARCRGIRTRCSEENVCECLNGYVMADIDTPFRQCKQQPLLVNHSFALQGERCDDKTVFCERQETRCNGTHCVCDANFRLASYTEINAYPFNELQCVEKSFVLNASVPAERCPIPVLPTPRHHTSSLVSSSNTPPLPSITDITHLGPLSTMGGTSSLLFTPFPSSFAQTASSRSLESLTNTPSIVSKPENTIDKVSVLPTSTMHRDELTDTFATSATLPDMSLGNLFSSMKTDNVLLPSSMAFSESARSELKVLSTRAHFVSSEGLITRSQHSDKPVSGSLTSSISSLYSTNKNMYTTVEENSKTLYSSENYHTNTVFSTYLETDYSTYSFKVLNTGTDTTTNIVLLSHDQNSVVSEVKSVEMTESFLHGNTKTMYMTHTPISAVDSSLPVYSATYNSPPTYSSVYNSLPELPTVSLYATSAMHVEPLSSVMVTETSNKISSILSYTSSSSFQTQATMTTIYTTPSPPRIGGGCVSQDECPVDSECKYLCGKQSCHCRTGYVKDSGSFHCLPLANLSQTCQISDQCVGPKTICHNNICTCAEGYEISKDKTRCRRESSWFVFFPLLHETCGGFLSECYNALEQVCLDGHCACKSGEREVTWKDSIVDHKGYSQCRNSSFPDGYIDKDICTSENNEIDSSSSEGDRKIRVMIAAIIGGVLGGVALIVGVVVIVCCIRHKQRSRMRDMTKDNISDTSFDRRSSGKYSFRLPRPFVVSDKDWEAEHLSVHNSEFELISEPETEVKGSHMNGSFTNSIILSENSENIELEEQELDSR